MSNWSDIAPYSWKLRKMFDGKLVDTTHSKTEILNQFMKLAVKREKENKFNDKITKELYFSILYDTIVNVLFENDYNLNNNK